VQFNLIVQLVIVPVGSSHLQATTACYAVSFEVAIADDVLEIMATGPMLRAYLTVSLHGIGCGKIVPRAIKVHRVCRTRCANEESDQRRST